MQHAFRKMNQINTSESALEPPCKIDLEPVISRIIEIYPCHEQSLAPKARVVLAKNPVEHPSHQSKRASCQYLLNRLLCSISATGNHSWKLEYAASGAPTLCAGEQPGLSVSMAHSDIWLAVGVSFQAAIGVDIERIKPRANIAEKAEFLNWKVKVKDIRDFYAKWTLWEATAKCVGGSVLMKYNPGFDQLCRIETRDRVGQSGQWSGLHDCLDEQIFYAISLQCINNTSLMHQAFGPQKMQPWSFPTPARPGRIFKQGNQCA